MTNTSLVICKYCTSSVAYFKKNVRLQYNSNNLMIEFIIADDEYLF